MIVSSKTTYDISHTNVDGYGSVASYPDRAGALTEAARMQDAANRAGNTHGHIYHVYAHYTRDHAQFGESWRTGNTIHIWSGSL